MTTDDDTKPIGGLSQRLGVPRGRNARIYGLAGLVNYIGKGIFFPFSILFFHDQLDSSLSSIGAVLIVSGVLGTFVAGSTGRLIDRFGARNITVTIALARAALLPTYLLIDQLWQFLLIVCLLAAVERTDSTSAQVIVSSLASPDERSSWFAMNRLALNAGLGSGALIGGVLVTLTDSYAPALLGWSAGCVTVAGLYLMLPARPGDREVKKSPSEQGPWRDGFFLLLSSFNGVRLLIGLALEIGLPIFVVLGLGLSPAVVAVAFFLNTALVTLLQLRVAQSTRKYSPVTVLDTGLAAYIAAFALLVVASTLGDRPAVVLVIVATVVFTAGEMLSSVTGMLIITDASPPAQLGAYVGVSQVFTGLAITVGPFVYAAGLSVSAGGFWMVLGALCAAMIVSSRWIRGSLAQRASAHHLIT